MSNLGTRCYKEGWEYKKKKKKIKEVRIKVEDNEKRKDYKI